MGEVGHTPDWGCPYGHYLDLGLLRRCFTVLRVYQDVNFTTQCTPLNTNTPPHHQTETSETVNRTTPPLFLVCFVTLILPGEQDLESPRRQDSRRVCEG